MSVDFSDFHKFSKEIDNEMKIFARYMMSRAVANGEGPSPRRYMVMLSALSRGMALLEFMLEEEGMRREEIDIALMAMKGTDQAVRASIELLKREMEDMK